MLYAIQNQTTGKVISKEAYEDKEVAEAICRSVSGNCRVIQMTKYEAKLRGMKIVQATSS